MQIINAMLYTPEHTFREGSLLIQEKRIAAVSYTSSGAPSASMLSASSPVQTMMHPEQISADSSEDTILNANGAYIIPGLIDLHLHGCMGVDFCDFTEDPLPVMADYLVQNGITGFTPATMTLPPEQLEQVFGAASHYQDKEGARFLGIHMEGPFFSEQKKGAQDARHLRLPSIEAFLRYQELSGGRITQTDIAPELPGALEYIKRLSKEVTVSLGHSAAGYEEAMAGFAAGASHVTHLYNGMLPFAHRDPGLVGAAAECPNVRVELIGDGIHIHPAMIRLMFRLFGAERILLISDSMRAAGMPDGSYSLGGQPVLVQGGRATLSDGTIAGSAVNLMECLRRVVSFGIPLTDAVRAASENQAKELGLFSELGSLEPGKYANLVLLEPALTELTLRQVMLEGKLILGKN